MPLDRSQWPKGPWDDEPDILEWIDEDSGLNCKMLRGPGGHWCGYVGVPKGHPAFGMSYDPIEYETIPEPVEFWRRHVTKRVEYAVRELEAHGGLTYAATENDGLHWFGFDCAHSDDLCPAYESTWASLKKHGLSLRGMRLTFDEAVYRDLKFVKNECRELAAQLAAIRNLKRKASDRA